MSALVRRAPVHAWIGSGASERRTLAVIGIGTSALSYCLRDDSNFELRWRLGALAHRRCRYGVGMIDPKLRWQKRIVKHKRGAWLYSIGLPPQWKRENRRAEKIVLERSESPFRCCKHRPWRPAGHASVHYASGTGGMVRTRSCAKAA
ncbi:hypothetical protein FHY29_003269 [Xanthomonas arboricola]